MEKVYDVIVIGGGQSALTCGYYLRRTNLSYLILDKQDKCGGAWNHAWDNLTLFSPAEHSSLAGWLMPKSENVFPLKKEVINYLCEYEKHYNLSVERSVEVLKITSVKNGFKIETTKGNFFSKVVIGATGTWDTPFIPKVKGLELFKGTQIHSANYANSNQLNGLKVLVVGEGNSGAQIVAEVSKVTEVKWSTRRTPNFLPDEVDGFYLFNVATAKYKAEKEGKPFNVENYNLGNIVMVPTVKEARVRGVLQSSGSFNEIVEDGVIWENGTKESFDVIIWCTGFGYTTKYLKELVAIDERGIIQTEGSKAKEIQGLWLVGFGNWSGYASATLIGINRNVKQAMQEIEEYLHSKEQDLDN